MFLRAVTFLLASLSFACLLGEMYGVWPMRPFACLVFPPAVIALIVIARTRAPWIGEAALAGIIAAVAYDLFRLPFVLSGIPLFKVFPQFGEILLDATEPRWLVNLLGWAYHFSNGASLGIMFLALVPRPTRANLFAGSIAFALAVEFLLLITPYASFFGLALNQRFLMLTLSAHLVFGVTLGLWLRWRCLRPA
jgi:hypothetical protein